MTLTAEKLIELLEEQGLAPWPTVIPNDDDVVGITDHNVKRMLDKLNAPLRRTLSEENRALWQRIVTSWEYRRWGRTNYVIYWPHVYWPPAQYDDEWDWFKG